MIFFIALLLLAGAARLLGLLGISSLSQGRGCMRLALSVAMIFFGTDHLLTPERYLAMIEGWLPWPEAIVAVTGLCEIAGGLGLLLPGLQRWAGLMLAVYFIAVFPANVHNALYGLNVQGLPVSEWYYWVRLGFQPLAVWWALFSSGLIRWPFRDGTKDNMVPQTPVPKRNEGS